MAGLAGMGSALGILGSGRRSVRIKSEVSDVADCCSSRTTFSIGVNAMPWTRPAIPPETALRSVGCAGMTVGPDSSVCRLISSSSATSSSVALSESTDS